ncbi:MAG: 3-deoxy-D-manno-octulosonic acid transferase [Bacteroidota bacterium]|nr:3-deoxy-D-manno-octulosonic acid transferase [Bacteroidota bacterium]
MILFYHLFLVIYSAGIHLASLWNKKAKSWVKGRNHFFKNLKQNYPPKAGKTVWMHCASLGEFEQGRPLLKNIKEEYPGAEIVITFFSPSGFDIVNKDKDFRQVYYLPMDSATNAKKLIDILKPDLVLWIKYEYWHYYLRELKTKNIPVLLISGVFLPSQPFFKWYGKFWRQMLETFSHFFVQNNLSKERLQALVSENKISIPGDTRCDRVINIASNFIDVPGIREFCGDSQVIVAGSTWEDDEAEWIHFVKTYPAIKFIIAPHEIDAENISDVKKEFSGSITYSEWIIKQGVKNSDNGQLTTVKNYNIPPTNCLIIDNIGMLARLYKYATITYVGGGFDYNGLHNILEAAVYGKPVIFGPEYEKNFEAQELIDCTGAISIENALELEKMVSELLANKNELLSRGEASRKYVYKNAGASAKIMEYIKERKLLSAPSFNA